ncbi:SLC13 family permease [Halobacillus karajensis]|uniref:Sodium-dependent dicarboxylate transporter SdcS n=1 Tax=Halobacillus karajensis TaxID=195088 RepID=A0A024P4J3_9BACI|nr:DASS family sodium-coupled anion symporter [Halobacillus karajensis]CDQ20547.1 Na(+)/dicarboxylate symporter [Halobacillus karajensis]CDQ23984.1 Na(+)/dicarboxylate symporter [Halobacillus karajensis]CDQ27462.1 Na(+)/dicarboxylate symporter [Halobacillus karajensis]
MADPSILKNKWLQLWAIHYQAKDLLKFTVTGNSNSSNPKHSNQASADGSDPGPSFDTRQKIGLFLGPVLFALTLLFVEADGLSQSAVAILASTLWIATWWITEAMPIPATSLLPLVLFPITGGLDGATTASSYGDNTIFLFMGGFLIALAMQKWNLHKRMALFIISSVGTSTEQIVLGFMVATGSLSMWISNTATAMMMVPIGMAVIYQASEQLKKKGETVDHENFNFGKAVMLGVAYSASIGGLATLIGTPPNTIFKGVIEQTYGIDISFAGWMAFGVPLTVLFLAIAWFYLVKIAYPMKVKELPGGRKVIGEERRALGQMSAEEKIVMTVFAFTAVAWISRSFVLVHLNENINDTMIAMTAAVVLFLIPSKNKRGDYLLDWDTAKGLPWGILLLFGAGLAVAAGFKETGLAEWIGTQLTVLQGANLILIIVIVTALVIFLTEITSNTATATMMFPIMGSLASAISVHPYSLMIAAGVAASCAFMLPVATPPNAVVFGSGYLKIPDMAKAGFLLNVLAVILITVAIYFYLPLVWGLDLTTFPDRFN